MQPPPVLEGARADDVFEGADGADGVDEEGGEVPACWAVACPESAMVIGAFSDVESISTSPAAVLMLAGRKAT